MRNKIILILILLFAFFSRVWRLDTPPTFYFDEVYHAFTAKEMLLGNKMAWEWWNTPPAGFAYEWTHPPLAKEAMEIGMKFLGINSFGWRLPGVLVGVGVILLIYLLGRNLFNKRVGFIAAFLASFDGLLFTQSRIGMNDIYFLFFMLLAFYWFIKSFVIPSEVEGSRPQSRFARFLHAAASGGLGRNDKWLFLMGISLGLSLASKWTAIYGIGILGGLYIISGLIKLIKAWPLEAKRPGLWRLIAIFFFTFLVIPLAIYLLTYLPFFQSGHTWAQFDELQHQMWWYHTGLKATHPYTSPWYSWPFLQRPVWYYVSYDQGNMGNWGNKGMVANIYGMGNPLIWWAGIVAIGWIVVDFILRISVVVPTKRSAWRNLAKRGCGLDPSTSLGMTSLFIVLLGYFGFFLPWALSPRIMFLYHYLPSLPFLCLALGWGLDRIWQIGLIGQIGSVKITGKLLTFLFLFFSFLLFLYFYPQLSALSVPKWWSDQYFWFASWR